MTVKRTERETEAFQKWRQLETRAMEQGGLLDLIKLHEILKRELDPEIDALPDRVSEIQLREAIADYLLDTFIPKYTASMAAYRLLRED